MAFSTIPSSLIEVGKAVKKELFTKVKDNFDDHETRIAGLEVGSGLVSIFNGTIVNKLHPPISEGIAYYKAPFDLTITDGVVQIFDKEGITTGSIEIDILKSTDTDPTNFVSIFSTKPKIDYSTASDFDASTNQVFSNAAILAGEVLRLDVTAIPDDVTQFVVMSAGEF